MSNTQFTTEQELFWAGSFGTEYVSRNSDYLAQKIRFFSKVLDKTQNVHSAIEFGANIGLNLRAINTIAPDMQLCGIEINKDAHSKLKDVPNVEAINGSILNFTPLRKFNLSMYLGVLIHINPDFLPQAYKIAYDSSDRYVLISEYYNPAPVMISYHGHENRLFKRDFAGEMMDQYPDLQLIDYGFDYRRDPSSLANDCTWFLMEKKTAGN